MKGLALEEQLKGLVAAEDHADFIYDLLQLYGIPKATIARLKKGSLNLAKADNQVICKRKVFFEYVQNGSNLLARIDALAEEPAAITHKPRFIIVTDYNNLLAKDTKTQDTLDTPFNELWKHSEFFLPWAGKERYSAPIENMVDVKAAEKMAKIYDEIYHHNKEFAETQNHALNVFLTRLLFCFFAEDTGIFPQQNQFSKALVEHTAEDGSDLHEFFALLFEAMDIKDPKDKVKYPSYIAAFPYVNGSLFSTKFPLPIFTAKVRQLMIECGTQNWREINPDIFGSMFQAVKIAKVRAGLGQHYTSVPNIMKVINPLFMDELREEFEKAYDSVERLKKLQKRLAMIRIFDPACGSGNFLIIAYKQLRLLELDILKRLDQIDQPQLRLSYIVLTQFYGIEIDDFACEIARLSLWLAEHQMNCKFAEELGVTRATLPLCEAGHIVCGNALRMNWEYVCPKHKENPTAEMIFEQALVSSAPLGMEIPLEEAEVYILGNPPYMGAKKQKPEQRADMEVVFGNVVSKNIDYISCWFYKGGQYIRNTHNKVAFVTTNSLNQGEQVSALWPFILREGVRINFAHLSFKWSNNAKHNAGVTCNIIGLACCGSKNIIYDGNSVAEAEHINAYLVDYADLYISPRKEPLSVDFAMMTLGSTALDGNFLKLTKSEYTDLCAKYPAALPYLKPFVGSDNFINNFERYCIWVENEAQYQQAQEIPALRERFIKCREWRMAKGRDAQKAVAIPYRFKYLKYKAQPALIIPSTSSENRRYIPIGFVNKETIVDNGICVVYNSNLWHFGVLTSHMHMVWVRIVGGGLETRLRYSSELCYNPFPFPNISEQQKKRIELCVKDILAVREKYSEKTMEELYDLAKMPADLLKAHESLDLVVESCYRKRPFETDEQRIKHLFDRYELMVNNASEADLKQLELF